MSVPIVIPIGGSGINNAVEISDNISYVANNQFKISDISGLCGATGYHAIAITVTTDGNALRASFCLMFNWTGTDANTLSAYGIAYYSSVLGGTCSVSYNSGEDSITVTSTTPGNFTNTSSALFAGIMTLE